MDKKPQWLIDCWALAPNIAREAERFIDKEIERAFQVLDVYGVPRERAKTVANGIDVLVTRFNKRNANSGYPLLGDSLPDDDKIKLVASDEASGIDWNDITYKKEWQEGFIAGAEWMRSEIK